MAALDQSFRTGSTPDEPERLGYSRYFNTGVLRPQFTDFVRSRRLVDGILFHQ